jgi:RNA polymerase sigma factor (sigma-70 family)
MTDTWIGGPRLDFPSTRWDLVRLAARDRVSMDAVVRVYWKPLYFFARQKGHDNEGAKDLVQGFLALLIARKVFAKADPEKGRFRTLLLAAFENHIKDRAKEAGRAKRGGDARVESLDFHQGEREYRSVPGDSIDRAWARELFAECVSRLESNPAHALALKLHLAGEGYPEIARRSGLSEQACRSAVSRLKGRFREILYEELRATALRESELAEEVAAFISLIR